jgi:hypothetical protein
MSISKTKLLISGRKLSENKNKNNGTSIGSYMFRKHDFGTEQEF